MKRKQAFVLFMYLGTRHQKTIFTTLQRLRQSKLNSTQFMMHDTIHYLDLPLEAFHILDAGEVVKAVEQHHGVEHIVKKTLHV